MPRSWQPSAFEAPSFALLWSGTPGGWASQRLIRLAEELRRQGYMCMVHEVRLEGEREEKARRHVELSQALRNARANVVVLNGTTAAHAYYRSAEQSGDSLAPTIVLLDDDQLEHVDELRSWYGRYAEQAWWPSRNVQLLGSNVVGEKQYVASGVPPSSTQWLPRWRLNAATESNRRPSECERVLVGGHAGCDHRLMRSVVETLPLALRARIDFVSPAATERWEISGRDGVRVVHTDEVFDMLQTARFVVSVDPSDQHTSEAIRFVDMCTCANRRVIGASAITMRAVNGDGYDAELSVSEMSKVRDMVVRCFEHDATVDALFEETHSDRNSGSLAGFASYLVLHATCWQ